MDLTTIINNPFNQSAFMVLMVWSLIWKGIALWKAARNNQRNWFVAMLILNTAGILEIVYIFYAARHKELPKP